MGKPKIIFRDISSQHFSATLPVYEKLKKEGFDCEAQVLKVPRFNDLVEFGAKHENDSHDLLVTASLTRYVFAGQKIVRGIDYGPDFFKAVKGREKSIFMSHGLGGEETPWGDYYEFKGVFLVGPLWMRLFTDFQLKTYVTACNYCGKTRVFTGEGWKKTKVSDTRPQPYHSWRCHTNNNIYIESDYTKHCKIEDVYSGGFPNLHLVGFPKLDILNLPERFKIAKDLTNELDLPHDKTVLYVPSVRRLDSFDKTILHLLKIFEKLDVNLIIKPHCGDFDIVSKPLLFNKARRIATGMKNVRWVEGTEIMSVVPLYFISDVVVSGSSSCLREFMLTNKPSIQLINIPNFKDYEYEGCIHSSLMDLEKNIIESLNNPELMYEQRQNAIKKIFYKPDGNATNRAVEKIKEVMKW